MSKSDSGPAEGARSVVEELKGKAKEAVGVVKDDDDLRDEGRAQQAKADAAGEAARHEAEAEKARLKEKAHEAEQRSHQRG